MRTLLNPVATAVLLTSRTAVMDAGQRIGRATAQRARLPFSPRNTQAIELVRAEVKRDGMSVPVKSVDVHRFYVRTDGRCHAAGQLVDGRVRCLGITRPVAGPGMSRLRGRY